MKEYQNIWASQENLSLGFPSRPYLNQYAQLLRLAKKLKFLFWLFYDTFNSYGNNKGADQTVWMHRLVCVLLFTNSEDRFSWVEAI